MYFSSRNSILVFAALLLASAATSHRGRREDDQHNIYINLEKRYAPSSNLKALKYKHMKFTDDNFIDASGRIHQCKVEVNLI
jgi:hypothetical protein